MVILRDSFPLLTAVLFGLVSSNSPLKKDLSFKLGLQMGMIQIFQDENPILAKTPRGCRSVGSVGNVPTVFSEKLRVS